MPEKAELRLDLEEMAFARLASDEGHALVAGHPNRSVLVDRILSVDPEKVMPPPESNLDLTSEEKAMLIKMDRTRCSMEGALGIYSSTPPPFA